MEKPTVKLIGEDGNAFAIMGKVEEALRKSENPEMASKYLEEVVQGDYNHLLRVTTKYVNIK